MYYGAITLLNPTSISVSTIASLQQPNSSECQPFTESVRHGEEHSSDERWRPSLSPWEGIGRGYGFELRNVSVSYPGSKEDTKALNDVYSLDQLVVVVGANASGKSTFYAC
ncbi:hypothetical protein BT96DRAFT_305769 [Gymnopus androsaceus JB14]|uniref:Uncharacterized protein n=1 Tax=Gymnopus androsaceus JB14 TaxID=1447944 RepID=A0A6A4I5J0_9AGAR|nr:hypothetical protein BT96DRAFT_305769 [Gymnopus androsaceus JB14]